MKTHWMIARSAAVCLALLAASGCTQTWTARTTQAAQPLQWPFAPKRAKLAFVEAITGFEPKSDAGSVLKAIAVGADSPERHAFVQPVAVARGDDGRLAVADVGRSCVHLFFPGEGRYVRLVGSDADRLVSPVGVAFDPAFNLYVSDSVGRVIVFRPDGAVANVLRSAGSQPLQRPTGIAFSPSTSLLYVADTLANRVFALHPDGTLAYAIGERGMEAGQFNFPTHLFRSRAGELVVTDSLNFRVQIFDERDGKPLARFGHHGDGSGDIAMPKGVAVDADGAIYVVDAVFDNVQLFDRDGTFLLTLGQRGVELGEFWLPSGATIGADRRLYVCDTYNHRVQVFQITEGYRDGDA